MVLEINRRVEAEVEKRMTVEREKRAQEVETEVLKRLAEARRAMSKEMTEELERQKQIEFKRFIEKEVHFQASFQSPIRIFTTLLTFKLT